MKTEWKNQFVRIRPFQTTDVDAVHEAAIQSAPEISRWLDWCHPNYSRQDTAHWIERREQEWTSGVDYSFAILDAEGDRFLGGCGLNHIHQQHRVANLGYWVRTSDTRRGVAAAATLLLTEFAFKELALRRVEIVVDVSNAQSRRVAEKVNAAYEGIQRNRLVTHGVSSDALMFSLIPKDLGL